MKFDERRLGELTRRLAAFRVVLVHGADPALVAERVAAVLQATGGRGLGVVELDGADHGRAFGAIEAPMLFGGDPVVRLRGASDAATSSVESVLGGALRGLLLVDATGLSSRSRLRLLAERHSGAASVQCRAADASEVSAGTDRILAEYGARIEPDVRRLFLAYAPSLEAARKLALFAAAGPATTVEDIEALGLGSEEADLEELAYAIGGRRGATADRLLQTALDDGVAPITVLRALLSHFTRLRAARQGARFCA